MSLPDRLLLGPFARLACNWFLCGSKSVKGEEEDPNEVSTLYHHSPQKAVTKAARWPKFRKAKGLTQSSIAKKWQS